MHTRTFSLQKKINGNTAGQLIANEKFSFGTYLRSLNRNIVVFPIGALVNPPIFSKLTVCKVSAL